MKISYMIRVLALGIVAFTLTACGSSQEKTSSDRSGSNERGANIDVGGALNAISYSPNGMGWAYKSTAVPGDFNTWATKFKPEIEQVLNAMAPGFKLQVTGHSCAIGPRNAEGGLPGNIYWSTERAKAVYNALTQAGLPAAKMTYRGVANDEPLPAIDAKDQKNRRVTFKIVQG